MDLAGIHPPQMNWEATNPLEAWKKFRQHVKIIFGGPLAEKSGIYHCGQGIKDVVSTILGLSRRKKVNL
jgi:hypothetical protein